MDETLTITPLARLFMARTPKWIPSITPRRLRSMACPQCSGSLSGKYGSATAPALFTSTSRPPNSSSAKATIQETSASEATSATTKAACPPSEWISRLTYEPARGE
jgi:hypothetical protein